MRAPLATTKVNMSHVHTASLATLPYRCDTIAKSTFLKNFFFGGGRGGEGARAGVNMAVPDSSPVVFFEEMRENRKRLGKEKLVNVTKR